MLGFGSAIGEEHGQQHEREHREQILDDEPADGDVSGRRVQVAMVGEHADEHDRARDGERHAEDDACRPAPAEPARDDGAEHRRDGALRDRAGNGDAPNGQQLFDMKLQADAEHQQDDADFGELFGDFGVGDEPGRVRTDQRARKQIADDRRQARALREVAEDRAAVKPPASVRIRSRLCTDRSYYAALALAPRGARACTTTR